jgi:transposase
MTCYSIDFRKKIIEAYEQEGSSIREVAKRFLVSPDTVRRLLKQYRQTGDLTPKKCGSKKQSVLSEHEARVIELVEKHPDYTLWQYCEHLTEVLGVNVSTSMMDRFCQQHNLTLKKKTNRSEKVITPAVQQARVDYWHRIRDVAPEKLVFIDETGFWVGMSRRVARALKGKKAYHFQESYRGQKLTMIGAIKRGEILATKTIEQSMKSDDFLEFIQIDLAPRLQAGDVVVMDNLNSHHRNEVREIIESVGARVEYLPVYSPDFNPIEMMWSQIKSVVRKFRTKTIESLIKIIELAVSLIPSQFLHNWFAKCCYCTE